MRRVDGYLSRIAHQHWPGALVYREDDEWWMERRAETPETPDAREIIGLGESFGAARQAVYALVRATTGETS